MWSTPSSEAVCAQRLLNAAWLFKDDVFDRLALINDIHDVFIDIYIEIFIGFFYFVILG